MRDDDILINIDKVFARPKVLPEFDTQRRSLKPRFPPHQAVADARTCTIDRGIKDTHLQLGEQHLPTRDLPCKSWLFKKVLNGIHVGNESCGTVEHILP